MMPKKTRDFSISSSKTVLIIYLMVLIIFPVFLGNFKVNSKGNYKTLENGLHTNEFTKNNYNALLENEEHGLGSKKYGLKEIKT